MDRHRRHLARGFHWLGAAAIVARIVDAATVLAVLLFLTKQQVGVSALVLSIGMIVESVNGLGSSEALIQGEAPSPVALDTLFWFILGCSAAMAALTMLAAPLLADAFGAPGIALLLLPIALKQPLVGAAVIPLALLNRSLRYERIAVVNTCASVLAAATRLALAAGGAGAWAPVAGYASSGVYVLVGAFLASPFVPAPRFRPRAIAALLRFGVRVSASNVSEQAFKNVDFLLVGAFYGTARLALYRVAFDLAMEPAMAIGTLVNRTVLPVIAQLATARADVTAALAWSLRRSLILAVPASGGLLLAATPLTTLLHDARGRSYAAAALPLAILAAASLVRIATQLLYPLLMGTGRPGEAARLSLLTLALLGSGIVAVGCLVPAPYGIVAVAAVWLAVYPPVLIRSAGSLHRRGEIDVRRLAAATIVPVAAFLLMVGAVLLIRLSCGRIAAWPDLALAVGATVLTYAVLALPGLRASA